MRHIKFEYLFNCKQSSEIKKQVFTLSELEAIKMDNFLENLDENFYRDSLQEQEEGEEWKVWKRRQFTWLLDKNGKEIYEGDIYHQWDTRILYVVEWMDTWLKGRQIWNRSYAWISYFQPAIEIIWNIYENKNLL